nr:glycosyltransferase family 4 protein [Ktedonobacterales bacterium]
IGVYALIQAYHPFVGGAERQLQSLTSVLPALGVHTTVITRRLPGPGFAPLSAVEGARVYRVRLRGGHVLKSVSYTLGALGILWRHRREVDILHAHELLSPTTTAVLAKLLLRRPVIVKVLGGGAMGDIPKLLAKPLGRVRMALFTRLVDRFLCVSAEIAEQLTAAGVVPEKLVHIPNGVDTDLFVPVPADERLARRARLGLPDGPLAVYVGRLSAEKGVRPLAEAWALVRRRCPGAQLYLLGDGPERAAIEQLRLPTLHLPGGSDQVVSYLQAADLFVLASEREGLSNALLEAMSAGLACVATSVGGTPEIVEDGRTGVLVPAGDVERLAEALTRVLEDEALRTRLGHAARDAVVQRYSLRSVAERLRAVYESVL